MQSCVFRTGQIITLQSHWEKAISSVVAEIGKTAAKMNSYDYSSNNGCCYGYERENCPCVFVTEKHLIMNNGCLLAKMHHFLLIKFSWISSSVFTWRKII